MKNKCEMPCVWNSGLMEHLNKHMLSFKRKGIVAEVAFLFLFFLEKMFSLRLKKKKRTWLPRNMKQEKRNMYAKLFFSDMLEFHFNINVAFL